MASHNKTKRITLMAVATALALIIGFIEMQFPFFTAIPGIKLGLGNVMVLFILYASGPWDALAVAVLKVVLSSLLFGNLSMMMYSASGTIGAYLMMLLCYKVFRFAPIATSICGAIAHNIGQIILAAIIIQNVNLYYYLAILIPVGALTGALCGIVTQMLLKSLKKSNFLQ